MAAFPVREMCHAWPACLLARTDCRGGFSGGEPGPLADSSGAPGRACSPCLACQSGRDATLHCCGAWGECGDGAPAHSPVQCRRACRSGGPPSHRTPYSADAVASVIAAALTSPRRLGLPFASWTLDRLAAYLLEDKRIAMRRSRIDEILLREGLRWRRHESWFGERLDPEFAEKRGGSRRSIPRRQRAA